MPLSSHSLGPPACFSSWQPLIYFSTSVDLPILDILRTWHRGVHDLWCLASLAQQAVFEVAPSIAGVACGALYG